MENTFRQKLDTTSKVMTSAIALGSFVPVFIENEKAAIAILILPVIFLFGLLTWNYKVSLNESYLKLHKLANNKIIPFSEIEKVERLPKSEANRMIRAFGNGGLFGYTGLFSHGTHGGMRLYATSANNMVLLFLRNGKKIVISPNEPENFIEALNKHLNHNT